MHQLMVNIYKPMKPLISSSLLVVPRNRTNRYGVQIFSYAEAIVERFAQCWFEKVETLNTMNSKPIFQAVPLREITFLSVLHVLCLSYVRMSLIFRSCRFNNMSILFFYFYWFILCRRNSALSCFKYRALYTYSI